MIEPKRIDFRPERHPLTCQWEITCRCNLRCVMCYTDCFNTPEKIRRELSSDEILRLMDELREAGVLELCLTGGEPMARPDFFLIYEHARQNGFLVTVFTNGTLIDEKAANRFAKSPPVRIEISLHGVSQKTFESVTQGAGSFQKCLRAIGLLLERRIPLLLKATAMTLNKDEILSVKAYARSLGVPFHMGERMRRALDGSHAPGRYDITPDELLEIERSDPEINREICGHVQEERVCTSGMVSFHIDAYGMLQLCSGNRRQGYDLRKGSFREGFYNSLASFPCPFKASASASEALAPVEIHV